MQGERLFAKNVFAVFQGFFAELKMSVRRGRHTNRVDLRVFQDFAVILCRFDVGIKDFDGFETFLVKISANNDLGIGELIENTDMVRAPMAAADNTYTNQSDLPINRSFPRAFHGHPQTLMDHPLKAEEVTCLLLSKMLSTL